MLEISRLLAGDSLGRGWTRSRDAYLPLAPFPFPQRLMLCSAKYSLPHVFTSRSNYKLNNSSIADHVLQTKSNRATTFLCSFILKVGDKVSHNTWNDEEYGL